MYNFKIKIADIVIEANVIYEQTKIYCKEYFCEEEPKFSVSISKEDILETKNQTEICKKKNNLPFENFPDYCYEISTLLEKIVYALIDYNILFFHGSVVGYKGKAYLFTAPSGTGKTTHTKLWLKNIKGSYILNGDKPLVKIVDEKIYICGTPWKGKEGYGKNEILPLSAICYLERSSINSINQTTLKELLQPFLKQVYFPQNSNKITKVMILLSKLSNINLYKLSCNMEDDASIIAFNEIVK